MVDPDIMASSPSRKTVGVSLKMYFDLEKTSQYIRACAPLGAHALAHSVDIFVIPDFLSLTATSTALRLEAPTIRLGAQDCFWEDSGAYTGEVSPAVLKSIGCSLVELGHAERRRLFGETDADVAKKARAVVRNGMTPLVCIGEKRQGTIEEAVDECRPQIESILEVTDQEIIFAYEPVWAIGQPKPASAAYVVAVTKELRKLCGSRPVRFLYGGSAGPGTFDAMRDGVDGLFLGRFAHDPERFREVITEVGAS
jgi:triosephosphate isomerase